MTFFDRRRRGRTGFGPAIGLGFGLCLVGALCLAGFAARAGTEPTTGTTATPATQAPGAAISPSPKAAPATPGAEPGNMPGVPSDASALIVNVEAKPTAVFSGKAKWADGFTAIMDALNKVKASVEKAGLKTAGRPLTVFTETDDTGFSYQAMLPLAAAPAANTELADGVKLGTSPSGKAIKFQHHGPYDDIDSTYDLITAYLDEKNLEAQDYFVEEYQTELKSADDPNLAVDIYVFLK